MVIQRTILDYKEKQYREFLFHMFRASVRPHLEYCIQFWSPYLKRNITALDSEKGHEVDTWDEKFVFCGKVKSIVIEV